MRGRDETYETFVLWAVSSGTAVVQAAVGVDVGLHPDLEIGPVVDGLHRRLETEDCTRAVDLRKKRSLGCG